ncbi:Hypothetical predicted protein [Octopus vulgaris]|uniref:Uncharacterized protein n=1 Tax=Octopus vulgaris TaxID=6645 RepID=A0AA36B1T7_OCTVU|nr:Hypothetical predicted protein [Octopus vulgaris]
MHNREGENSHKVFLKSNIFQNLTYQQENNRRNIDEGVPKDFTNFSFWIDMNRYVPSPLNKRRYAAFMICVMASDLLLSTIASKYRIEDSKEERNTLSHIDSTTFEDTTGKTILRKPYQQQRRWRWRRRRREDVLQQHPIF